MAGKVFVNYRRDDARDMAARVRDRLAATLGKEYLPWLSRKTGKTYRLLTEAEWEYAARAGTTTPFSTGRTITPEQANFDGNYTYGGSAKGLYRQKTVDVGTFPPSAFGLYDMHGNVWEWVQDCWNASYQGAPSDGSGWMTGDCGSRVLRGGSWLSFPQNLRSAFRSGNPSGQPQRLPRLPFGQDAQSLNFARLSPN
jgi:formylglycine-generating enzyme required for sulfatase activity